MGNVSAHVLSIKLTWEPLSNNTVTGYPLSEHLSRVFLPTRGSLQLVLLLQVSMGGFVFCFGRAGSCLGFGLTSGDWGCALVSGCPSAET